MKIAVVGSGISGLVCAYLLNEAHEVTLFEREPRLGGHTHTRTVRHEGRDFAVDTGFIVFNERNYPKFCTLLRRLGVASRSTTMSFSVRDEATGFEYGGSSLRGAIGSWKNLVNPRWWRIARGIASLGRTGSAALAEASDAMTIGDLYTSGRFSRGFLDDYLIPMAAAIWSAPRDSLMQFPARFMLRFFDNHGMLNLRQRPQWRTISGGSHSYIEAMNPVLARITRTNCGVQQVLRSGHGATVHTREETLSFDAVILALHSDQALSILGDPTPAERDILSAMPYQANETLLHCDPSLLPRRRKCWAAWNYRLSADPTRPIAVTYNMSILQGLDTNVPLCVTLNDAESVDPAKVITRLTYHHPLYSLAGDRARGRWAEISGIKGTHYCGAYWGNGFHEDGVASAVRVCEQFGVSL